MHLLYITEFISTHDQRFAAALIAAEHSVSVWSLQPERDHLWGLPGTDLAGGGSIARHALYAAAQSADVIHAGPLPSAGFLAAAIGLHPIVATSWAYDLLLVDPDGARQARRVRKALSAASLLIVDALAVEEGARDLGYGGPVVRFPWGVDLDTFRPPNPLLEPPVRSVVCTRAWEPIYQISAVIDAFEASGKPKGRLRLLNDGSERTTIMQQISQSSVGDRVSLGGRVTESALADELRAADLYVSAALTDGSSVSLLQALATGLPIIASDIPGNAEWLSGLTGARLVAPHDRLGWAEGVAWGLSLTLNERRTILGEHRALAEARADWSVHSQTLVSAYESAAESWRTTGTSE